MKINHWVFFNRMVYLSTGSSTNFSQLFESYYVARHRERDRVAGHDPTHPPFHVNLL
jgi:hypothetical protein